MQSKFWFELDENEIPASLTATINEIENRQSRRYLENLLHLGMYSGRNLTGLGLNDYDEEVEGSSRISLNVIQACTDTITSKIGKNNPKITFLTSKGSYSQQERAKKLEQFVGGQFSKTRLYTLAPKVLKTACIFGDGLVKVYQHNSQIFVDRVLPNEIIVDSREAIDGKPRTIYQLKQVSKYVLINMYPNKEREIEECTQQAFINSYSHYDPHFRFDMVPVIEAWRLPSRKGAGDGVHVISIPTASLLYEKWERPYFPFPKLSFSDKVMGYWSAGIAEILYSIQCELNRVAGRISDSIWINSVPRVYYEQSSKLNKEQYNNEVGSMVGYRGTMPQIITPTSVGSDVFNHIDRMWQRAFEIAGISQMSVGSIKQTAMSGKAIRESQDTESDRFATLKQNYDEFHLEIADQMIDCAKDIYEYDKSFSVLTKDQYGVVKIKWSEVDMDKDAYIMETYPTNLLSSHPSGKLADVIDLMNAGLLEREDALSLLDYPDIKAVTNIATARKRNILFTIETMIEKGKYIPPEVTQDLQGGISYCTSFYLSYKERGVPQQKLDLLLRWIEDASAIIAAMAPPAPAPMPELPPGAGAPMENVPLQ